MRNHSRAKNGYIMLVAGILGLILLTGAAPNFETAQPICIPRLPMGSTVIIDGDTATDWDTFSAIEIEYADDPAGDFSTLLVADDTSLYFRTEVKTSLSSSLLPSQTFFIAVHTSTSDRMLQIKPFIAGEVVPLSDKELPLGAFETNLFGLNWDTWTEPALPTVDFHRVLTDTGGMEKWILEGRVSFSDLTGTDPGDFDPFLQDFDLFLHINTGTTQRYWPTQSDSMELEVPSTVTFGENRCPIIHFSEPYINFGKMSLNPYIPPERPITFSNDGAAGSQLQVQSVNLDPAGVPFTLVSVMDSDGSSPPFALATGEAATVTVRYDPTIGSTIADPHQTDLVVNSNDPDDRPASLPIEGNGREHIDTVFILDQSGSMLSQDKWVTTEWATEIAFEVLRLFSLSGDKVGAVGFGGPSDNPQSFVLETLDYFPSGPTSFTSAFADADNSYYTPIGFGLMDAHHQFGTDGRTHVGVLMSDGKHNRPPETKDATTVAGLNLPWPVRNNNKNMQIHTVALGHDAGVSTALLEAIRAHYGGASTTYNITEDPAKLAELFIEPLVEPLVVNRVGFVVAEDGFPIPKGVHKALAMVAWRRGLTPQDIRVQAVREDGTTQTYDSSSSGYFKRDLDLPYTYILLEDMDDFEQNQVWRISDDVGGNINPDDGYFIVLEDLNIKGVFNVEQAVNGTGNDIILKAKLTEVGQPLTNTPEHPVQVEALISKPDEGFGTYVSTHDPKNCRAGKPELPPVDIPAGMDLTDLIYLWRRGLISLPTHAPLKYAAAQAQVDVPAPRFLKIAALFEQCGKERLIRSELPGLQMFDDGTHGDQVAGDGIYTLRFSNTEYEGSYVVRFRVKGTSPTGAVFSRIRTISRYLCVDVDPTVSVFSSRVYWRDGDTIVREYYVIPLDRFGNYLGPGYPDQVEFHATGGEWVSPVIDYNNGIYSRLLRYERTEGKPDVTPVVQGETIRPSILGCIPWWLCLVIMLLLLLIILILLLLLIRCRRRNRGDCSGATINRVA